MTRLAPAPGVAVVEEADAVYIARLPDGPIAVLEGVAAVIWIEACSEDRETLAQRVATLLDPPPGNIAREVDDFVERLIDQGLLQVRVD